MGKYTNVAAGLKPKPEESQWQESVNQVKRDLVEDKPSESDLAKKILLIRQEKDRIKELLSAINIKLGAYEQLIADKFEDAGITQVRLETGETIRTQMKPYARVTDRSAFREWCIGNGLEEALVLPWQTTNALVSDRLVDGLDEPDGIDTFKQTTVILRRGRS